MQVPEDPITVSLQSTEPTYLSPQNGYFRSEVSFNKINSMNYIGDDLGSFKVIKPGKTYTWSTITSVTISNGVDEVTLSEGISDPLSKLTILSTDNNDISMNCYLYLGEVHFELYDYDDEGTEITTRYPIQVVSVTANGKTYTNFEYIQ